MAKNTEKPSDEIQRHLKTVLDHFDKEDRFVRERQIRQWKKLKYYWNGFYRLWWSEVAHDWRVYDVQSLQESSTTDASFYDKPVNVFRAYLESIIAALSVTTPAIHCVPDDADNPLDLSTAKAGDKIAELIARHNDSTLLWIHALYLYCTEGLIAAYNYTKEDESYGTYDEKEYEDVEEVEQVPHCAMCGIQLDPLAIEFAQNEQDEFDKGDDDVLISNVENAGGMACPQCSAVMDPEIRENKFIVTKLTGVTKKPKSRQIIEVYGGLFVKVPVYARQQCDMPYLLYSYETHFSNVIERYPHLQDKYGADRSGSTQGGTYEPYERWGRLSTQYMGEQPINTPTVRSAWLRHSAFNVLPKEHADKLKKLYPNGCKVTFVNNDFAEACNECLDDHWTLTRNPTADYLHHDPLGNLLTSVQEITNDIIALVLQTIEHGIGQTFVDPAVLDFDAYRSVEATPGMLFPTKSGGGKSIADGFFQIKTANLSGEVQPFAEKVQEMGQLVSGALPSLFGGAAPNSSKTASQYAMSRAQALQRLQTPWKMLGVWWKEVFGKVIPAYIKDVVEDEHMVKKTDDGNFINVFIRKAELQGKIGSIELETSDEIPTSWAQKKDVLMELIQLNNPEILKILGDPENLPLVADAIGLPDFNVPGTDDRQKQYEEIKMLLASEPIKVPQMVPMGMGPQGPVMGQQEIEVPSIEIEPDVDNHGLEAEVCRHWLVSEAGRLAKIENPAGYKNVLLHMQMHMQEIQKMNMERAMAPGAPQNAPQSSEEQNGQANGQ